MSKNAELTWAQKQLWLQLYFLQGLGNHALVSLMREHPEPREIFSRSRPVSGRFAKVLAQLHSKETPENKRKMDACTRWLEQDHHHIITLRDPHYPELLRHISNPPAVIFVDGQVTALHEPQLAIVGSRKPTPQGRENTFRIACEIAQQGLAISSGLALGIDGAAHKGALHAQGITCAVLGCGIDHIYPKAHLELAAAIRERGALISEFAPGTPVLAKHFPRRNRIISGLSLGLLVVEAATKSGSLISARLALDQGREVMAVPGSINSPTSAGCHDLIRDGAELITCPEHILAALSAPLRQNLVKPNTPELPAEQAQLLESMGFETCSVDRLVDRTGLAPEHISGLLFELEMAGFIEQVPGGVVRKQ